MKSLIRNERIKILERADYLMSQHSTPMRDRCEVGCQICNELKHLGKRYEFLTSRKRMKDAVTEPEPQMLSEREIESKKMKIISKGMDATKSEIRFLIEVAKVNKRDAATLIGMNHNHFFEACRNWGIGEIRLRKKAN